MRNNVRPTKYTRIKKMKYKIPRIQKKCGNDVYLPYHHVLDNFKLIVLRKQRSDTNGNIYIRSRSRNRNISLWPRAYARNVRLQYPYRQITILFILNFINLLIFCCSDDVTYTKETLVFKIVFKIILCFVLIWFNYHLWLIIFLKRIRFPPEVSLATVYLYGCYMKRNFIRIRY